MAKYGEFKYGTGVLYGVVFSSNTVWTIDIDWDNDGVFDGNNEALRAIDLYIKRGRDNLISISSGGVAQGFEPMRPATATLTLDNYDYKYNPYNTSSPLYGNIEVGRLIRIQAQNTNVGAYLPAFYGTITDIQPAGGTDRKVVIKAVDGLQLLADADVSLPLEANYGISEAIDSVLTGASWRSQWARDLETDPDQIPYWWAAGKALREITKLADSGIGIFFHAADGTAKYYNRYHYVTPATTITSADVAKNITYPQPWEVQRNKIMVSITPRTVQATSAIYSANFILSIPPNTTGTLWITYSYGGQSPVPAVNVITPVAVTDYSMNSDPSGAGTDLTSSLSIVLTNFGTTAKLEMTNSHATQTGYVYPLQVRGDPLFTGSKSTIIEQSGSADRALVLDLDWVQTADRAQDYATYLLAWMETVKIFPTIILEGRPDIQFGYDLQDTLTFEAAALGINNTYKVGMIEHRWQLSNGQSVQTRMALEPLATFDPADYWVFPTEIGITSILGF